MRHEEARPAPARLDEFSMWVSLMLELLTRTADGSGEEQERLRLLESAMAGVGQTGLDSEQFLRHGFADVLMTTVLSGIILAKDGSARDVARWRAALHIGPGGIDFTDPPAVPEAEASLTRAIGFLLKWIASAPVRELLRLSPPAAPEEYEGKPIAIDDEYAKAYKWLVYRSTGQPLQGWDSAALHYEWRWLHLSDLPGVPLSCVEETGPAEGDLNAEIAKRAVLDVPAEREFDALRQISDSALKHLSAGRFEAAATLMKFHVSAYPDDPTAHNDLGFCLIPSSPSEALHNLEVAKRCGYQPASTNVHNILFCLVSLNRLPEALDSAEFWWNRERGFESLGAHLWSNPESPQLIYVADPVKEVVNLALNIAEQLGRKDRVTVWKQRADALPH